METSGQSAEHRSSAGNLPAHSVTSARTGHCLGMWEIRDGSGNTGTVHCYWTEFEVPAAVITSCHRVVWYVITNVSE